MPERQTLQRARRDKREGKSATTQAGEFVREEMHHIREGKHGARSSRQAIAIGLSKARRAGVDLKPPAEGRTSPQSVRKARRDYARHGESAPRKVTPQRRAASERALEREPREAASPRALARQGRSAARRRSPGERAAAARKAAQTKGAARRSAAARKAAHTRSTHRAGSRSPTARSMHA